MGAYKYEEQEADAKFTAVGITTIQGAPMLAVVLIDDGQLKSTHFINPTSSHASEIQQMLTKIQEALR